MSIFERAIRLAVAAVTVLAVGACGTGGGTETTLPPGGQTTAPPGDLVLYAALADADEIVAYRLGTDGFLPADPFDRISVENPRDLLLRDDVLYAALEDRVVAIRIGSDGSLPFAPTSQTAVIEDADGVDLLIRGDVLYVAYQGIGRIYAYDLDQGQLSGDPISSSGTAGSDYRSMAESNGFLYAGNVSEAEIHTYLIQPDGTLLDDPEPQDPETIVYRPEDMLISNGLLYVISQSRARIETFEILASGLLPEDENSKTSDVQRYARILLDGDRLYASGFGEGRIDVFQLDPDGTLPKKPYARTSADAATFPINMVLENGILYVTQAGPGRIDAYVLGADGSPSDYPSSSTLNIEDSEPIGLVMGSYPP